MKLDIGCGTRKRVGYIGMDRVQLAEVDIVHNLTAIPWPLDNDSCTAIHMDNVIEHLPDTVSTFNELFRIAASGCRVEIIYPYWRSFGGYADPTHVKFFNEYMIDHFMRPGSSSRNENKYAFYTDKYWRLISRELITYPFLAWIPDKLLSFTSRHFMDVIHGVKIIVTPEK